MCDSCQACYHNAQGYPVGSENPGRTCLEGDVLLFGGWNWLQGGGDQRPN